MAGVPPPRIGSAAELTDLSKIAQYGDSTFEKTRSSRNPDMAFYSFLGVASRGLHFGRTIMPVFRFQLAGAPSAVGQPQQEREH